MRHDPGLGAIGIMLRSLKMYGMAQAVTDLTEQGAPAFDAALCAFHGSWAAIPRDRGHSFHGILGSHSTGRWAAILTDGSLKSGLD